MLLPDMVKTPFIENISKLTISLRQKDDIRTSMKLLSKMRYPLTGLIDISTEPATMYISFLISNQLSYVSAIYEGRTKTWYELNSDNINELREKLLIFLNGLKENIEKDNEEGIYDSLKTFFSEFHKLARSTSKDAIEG